MARGDRMLGVYAAAVLAVGLVAGVPIESAQSGVKLDGYAEWKRPGELIVDGQRVHATPQTRWKGRFKTVDAVPLGDEVRFVPGHGPMSTFGHERRTNPFVGDAVVASTRG